MPPIGGCRRPQLCWASVPEAPSICRPFFGRSSRSLVRSLTCSDSRSTPHWRSQPFGRVELQWVPLSALLTGRDFSPTLGRTRSAKADLRSGFWSSSRIVASIAAPVRSGPQPCRGRQPARRISRGARLPARRAGVAYDIACGPLGTGSLRSHEAAARTLLGSRTTASRPGECSSANDLP
jgi:hypothetical protein